MNRRSKTKRSSSQPHVQDAPPENSPDSSSRATQSSAAGQQGRNALPGSTLRTLISVWIPLHLFALSLSLTATVGASSIQSRLLTVLKPYLQLTHFDADDRPVYLTHLTPSEQSHRLQFTDQRINSVDVADQGEVDWQTMEPPGYPGLAESDRYGRWLATAATLAENDQPSVTAELLAPVVRADRSIQAIRIIRISNHLNTELDDTLQPPYAARVIRRGDDVALIELQEARLSAVADPDLGDQQ